jgi:hypothetical protein
MDMQTADDASMDNQPAVGWLALWKQAPAVIGFWLYQYYNIKSSQRVKVISKPGISQYSTCGMQRTLHASSIIERYYRVLQSVHLHKCFK